MTTFLIGGGREPGQVLPTHRPFVAACGGGSIACLVADEGDGVDAERWTAQLGGGGRARDPRGLARRARCRRLPGGRL